MCMQDCIIYYIPGVPFLFVFMLLINPKPASNVKSLWQSDEDYAREQLEKQKKAAGTTPDASAPKP